MIRWLTCDRKKTAAAAVATVESSKVSSAQKDPSKTRSKKSYKILQGFDEISKTSLHQIYHRTQSQEYHRHQLYNLITIQAYNITKTWK